ncbi:MULTISPECIES: TIGR03617 family F420-dependent LLM class oxidoreductase [Nonomuraea]|uniref:TIGR03617 family F420-dependent LLM class oxidoreductase n=1 Tax=Nonomuraea ferruginea TaxID=46174 RepID=A0ABT4T0Y5_9ACTN|nr:TIGR03617 family F420-dependent LLM class oxidoreductase [Nonomuraea ferruginea]MDA0643162.1 TIGR03617 family F420-dependent LLM class oxidoreductase [Nonomuraea ferruginea]
MKTGVHAFEAGIADVAACAAWAEEAGYDVVASAEVDHDPFLPLALAARDTSRVRLATTIAVAFARTPMTMAYVANDLQALSGGRFVLGLGTQTKPHITRRFGMPWGRPAARMREYITALRAIWDDWNTGRPVRHEGEHYRHTLMTATFRPAPHGHGNPPIHLAAVGPLMTRLAGEVADGLIPHGFSTERYFREVTLPALEEGLARAGRDRSEVTVHCPGFVHVHAPGDDVDAQRRMLRGRVAFYGSTPAYRGVLDLHGWQELHERLHALSVTPDEDRWDRMADLVDDEVLDTFCVSGSLAEVTAEVSRRFGGLVDQVHIQPPAGTPAPEIRAALASLKNQASGVR